MRITSSMLRSNRMYARKMAQRQSTNKLNKTTSTRTTRGRQPVKSSSAVDKYIKLCENAESLRSSANVLGSTSKNNIFENAKSTGSKDALLSQAKQMVSGYNSTISSMRNENSSLSRVYKQLMENAATENSESLSNIGITVNRDKSLSIDEAKFKNASIDDIEAALGSKSGFTSRVGSTAENVSRNALSTATNLSRAYGSYGASSYNSYSGLGNENADYLSALLSGYSRNFWG